MAKYIINKKFNSSVQRSSRVLEVAEAFGLGLEEKEFVLYDNVELEVNQGDVVYITGQSGSGKSVLLRDLSEQMQSLGVADIDKVELEDKPLVDQLGNNTNEASRILSAAGLNDAYLFVRTPKELSDGQLYRFKVAKLIQSGAKVWAADEFGAVLDRTTAKIVAYNIRRQAKAAGATLMVATTHKDLLDELAPNLYVEKRYQDMLEVKYDSE